MIVTPLAGNPARPLAGVLEARGWPPERAHEAADGMSTSAFHCEAVSAEALESLVVTGGRLGLEVITGDDWALVSGARSRLAVFARPWSLPPALAELATAIAAALPPGEAPGDD